MATLHSLGNRSPIQQIDVVRQPSSGSATARRTVMNQGSKHQLEDLVGYLQNASPVRVDNFELRQLNTAADLRVKFRELIEQWVDAKALVLFASWARQQLSKLHRQRTLVPPQKMDSLPDDVHELDPFFRTRAESNAIRRRLTIPQRKRWAAYFERFGCHACGSKAERSGCGFCSRCYARVKQRFQAVEDEIRVRAAIGR